MPSLEEGHCVLGEAEVCQTLAQHLDQRDIRAGRRGPATGKAGVERNFRYNELVGWQGGMTPLLFAARQGSMDAVNALIDFMKDFAARKG